MNFEIPIQVLRAALICTSRDSARYPINGAHVEWRSAEEVIVSATDGKVLIAVAVPTTSHGWIEPTEFTIPNEVLDAAEYVFKPDKRSSNLPLIVQPIEERVRLLDTFTNCAVEGHLNEGVFPNWRQVVPRAPFQESSAIFDPQILQDFVRVGRLLGEPIKCVRPQRQTSDEMSVEAHVADLTREYRHIAVIMPMRGDKESPIAIPDWCQSDQSVSSLRLRNKARAELMQTVIAKIADQLVIPSKTVTAASKVADLGADSFDLAELLMELEEAFSVRFENSAWKEWKTVSDIVAAIEKKKVEASKWDK